MHSITIINPLVALLTGLLILIFPKALSYIVAFYLIAIGLIGMAGVVPWEAVEKSQ